MIAITVAGLATFTPAPTDRLATKIGTLVAVVGGSHETFAGT